MQNDFDKWSNVKKRTDGIETNLIIDEGDIRWCRIGLNIGDETYGKGEYFSRPVLIVKKFSKNLFWGIPVTTKPKRGSWYFYIPEIDRTIIINQMRLFDKKRLEDRLFVISRVNLLEIKNKICFLLKS